MDIRNKAKKRFAKTTKPEEKTAIRAVFNDLFFRILRAREAG
jgi:hypothetical protein